MTATRSDTRVAKIETEPPAVVKDVVQRYLDAIRKQDVAAMAAVVEVPFLDLDRQFIRDRTKLPGVLERLAQQWPKRGDPDISFSLYLENEEWPNQDEVAQTLFAEALDDNDWAVRLMFNPLQRFTLLVRVSGPQSAAIVAGPLKPNQIYTPQKIPEPADSALTDAESMVLYSLDPDFRAKGSKDRPQFCGWSVLGKTAIRDASVREELVATLREATANNPGLVAACFNPRHGLRLVKGDKTVDLVICFECFSAQIFVDDKPVGGFLTTHSPRAAFDAPLTAAGIPIAGDQPAAESPPSPDILEGNDANQPSQRRQHLLRNLP
ncbi:hypothetical protein NA78x_003761 [Anatilimnocola sp. NA78]|uniref:hypothetical protein n=1 Tax=Anatilimnocola sp. NA78 TaxID=3415683 RepID=UPI003CE55F3B